MVVWKNSKTDIVAYVTTISFVLFLLIFGWKFHTIEEVNTAERDGYVTRAEQIRLGNIPTASNDSCDTYACIVEMRSGNLSVDPYRPYLYPILSAGFGTILDNTFAGARLTSALFAGLSVLLTYWLGKLNFSKEIGLFAVFAIVLNHVFIVEGLHVTSDMSFTALALLVLFFALRVNHKPELRLLLLLALSFALAYFTRYTALFLTPTIILGLTWVPQLSKKKFTINLAVFIFATVVFLLPHFFLTAHIFGNPFYSENWKNLAFKLYGNWDWSYFERIPFDGLFSVIAYSPTAFVRSSLGEILTLFRLNQPYTSLSALGGGGIIGILFTLLFLAGVYDTLFFLDRKKIIILSFLVVYTAAACALFFPYPRIILPILPLGYLFAGSFLSRAFVGSLHFKDINIRSYIPITIMFLLLICITTARQLPQFINRHPIKELEAALALQNDYGSAITVLGTFPFLQRYVEYNYYHLDDAHGDEGGDKNKYYERLEAIINEVDADYIIVGELSLRSRPRELLIRSDIPSYLHPLSHNADVTIYEVKKILTTSE